MTMNYCHPYPFVKTSLISITKLCTILMFIVGAAGCQHSGNRYASVSDALLEEARSFVDKEATVLIDEWGYPDNQIKDPRGWEVYQYDHVRIFQEPIYVDNYRMGHQWLSPTYVHGGNVHIILCRIWFIINGSKISKIRYKGSGCPAGDEDTKTGT